MKIIARLLATSALLLAPPAFADTAGAVNPGTSATQSDLQGCYVYTTAPSPVAGQQMAVPCPGTPGSGTNVQGNQSNAAGGTTGSLNLGVMGYNYYWNGTSWGQWTGAITSIDGGIVTLGSKADAAGGTGSQSLISLTKQLHLDLLAPLPAGTNAIGGVTGVPTTYANTPTISTSAYVSGYVLGGIQSFTSAPTSGWIDNASITFNSGTFSGSVDLVIFNASPTGGGTTDHAAFALTSTDTAKVIGVLHVTDCTTLNSGTIVQCQLPPPAPQQYTLAASGTTIYVVAVVRGTPTFTGTTDAIFNLSVTR